MRNKLLITADWHVRGTAPRCRIDEDWLESQRRDIAWVVDLALEEDAIVTIVGDIFHTARASTPAVNMVIQELQRLPEGQLFILAGNHDLPYHSYDHLHDSSIGILLKYFPELECCPAWDAYPFGLDAKGSQPLRFLHRLVFPTDAHRPIEDCGETADDIVREFPDNQTIICGDYHHYFEREFPNGQKVLNPGCLNIQVADMMDYQPKVILADLGKDGNVEKFKTIRVPQPEGVFVSDDYLVEEKERETRLDKFLETVQTTGKVSLNFLENLAERSKNKNVPKDVREIIDTVIQEVTSESI